MEGRGEKRKQEEKKAERGDMNNRNGRKCKGKRSKKREELSYRPRRVRKDEG